MPLRAFLTAQLLASLMVVPCQAQTDIWLDTFKGLHPFAALTLTDDSNLLRLSDDAMSDQYRTLEAGFDTAFNLSRQRFLIDGRIYRNSYDRFDQFDHTGGDARVLWKWLRGRLWQGDLGYKYVRKLRDFANQRVALKDMIDRHKVFASATRRLTTRWQLGISADWTDISASERSDLDKRLLGGGGALDYVSEAGNSLGLEVKYRDASFDSVSVRDYQEWYTGPTARWRITDKTLVQASAGYLRREHDSLGERDFAGLVGRITAFWNITEKTSLSATVWRDISSLGDEIADYAVIDGITLEPTWAITAKTNLRALASYEQRDFEDSSLIPPGIEKRVDEVSSIGLWIDWHFLANSSLSAGYQVEKRDSNRELEEYISRSFWATLRIGL